MPEAVNRQKIKKLSAAMAAIPPICLKVLVILSAAEASLDGSEAGAALAAMDPGAVTVEGG